MIEVVLFVIIALSRASPPCVFENTAILGSGEVVEAYSALDCCHKCRASGPERCVYFSFAGTVCSFRVEDTPKVEAMNYVSGGWPTGCRWAGFSVF